MMLEEETAVALAALPMDQYRDHLRLGTGFAEDGLQDSVLEGFLRAALTAIEARTSKALLSRSFVLDLTAVREIDRVLLPVAPVREITSVALVDGEGAEAPVDPATWRLIPDAVAPCLLARQGSLPTIPADGLLRVRFVAGFGVDWAAVPADLGQAMMMLAAHYYEHREDTALDGGCMPFGVSALIERYRPVRLFGGRP